MSNDDVRSREQGSKGAGNIFWFPASSLSDPLSRNAEPLETIVSPDQPIAAAQNDFVQQVLILFDSGDKPRGDIDGLLSRFMRKLSTRFSGAGVTEIFRTEVPACQSPRFEAAIQSMGIEILVTKEHLVSGVEVEINRLFSCLKLACPNGRVVRCDAPFEPLDGYGGGARNPDLFPSIGRFIFSTQNIAFSSAANDLRRPEGSKDKT